MRSRNQAKMSGGDGVETPKRVASRRDFLKGAGAAGAGLVATSLNAGASPAVAAGPAAVVSPASPGEYARVGGVPASRIDFGRMFPNLPPFAHATDTVRAALLEVGRPGGILDAGDQLSAGPKPLIVDPTVNGNPTAQDPYGTNPDNPTMTAGSTFVGQFIDHDITFDQTSQLGVPQNPLTSPNTRTPALDLDSVFGGGPGVRPDLYVSTPDGSVGPKLKIGSGGVHEDVALVGNGDGTYTALLGDPRNDETLIIAGLHRRVHADRVRQRGVQVRPQHGPPVLPRQLHQRHGRQPRSDEGSVLRTRVRRKPVGVRRPHHRRPRRSARRLPWPAPLRRLADLLRLRRRPGQEQQKGRHHDLERDVHPPGARDRAAHPNQPDAAAQRNLLRQLTWGLPSGQAVVRAMGLPALGRSDLADIAGVYAPFGRSTPLWYYVLAEAKALAGGFNLGPAGGRLVTETLIGLLRADPTSYLSAYPCFQPFLGTDLTLGPNPNPNITGNRAYTRAHFLYYAGVVKPGAYR